MAPAPSLIFISGGVRSGKSSFAEQTAIKWAGYTGGNLHYIATGVPFDKEMQERIKKHRYDRENSNFYWHTIEQSVNIGELANQFHNRDILLLDCVTNLLNNELYSAEHDWDKHFLELTCEKMITGILEIKRQAGILIVVSNEVFQEPLLENELVFTYKRMLGKIHQRLVEEADQAYLVEAGMPMVMKGVIR